MAEANSKPDYEQSELLLYHNVVLSDMGDHEAALEHLNSIEKIVLDKKAIKEQRAMFYLALGRLEEAETAYRSLIAHNPDNFAYFDGLLKSLGLSADKLSDEDQIKVLDMFKDFQKEYPRSNVAKRLPLKFATGERFVKIADEYLRNMLRKGVPSLFVNIKTLYTNKEKEQAIETLMLGYLAALNKSQGFDNSGTFFFFNPDLLVILSLPLSIMLTRNHLVYDRCDCGASYCHSLDAVLFGTALRLQGQYGRVFESHQQSY